MSNYTFRCTSSSPWPGPGKLDPAPYQVEHDMTGQKARTYVRHGLLRAAQTCRHCGTTIEVAAVEVEPVTAESVMATSSSHTRESAEVFARVMETGRRNRLASFEAAFGSVA